MMSTRAGGPTPGRAGRARRLILAVVALTLLPAALAASSEQARAAGAVAKLSFSPSPLGSSATVGPSTTVAVTLTATDSTGQAVPSATVWLAFKPAAGGGIATVGSVRLKRKNQSFVVNASGQIGLQYTTPATKPSSGTDILRAENTATRATSTVVGIDTFSYSPVAGFNFSQRPVARRGSLPGNVHIPLTITVVDNAGSPLAGASVMVTFKQAPNGGSASANGVPLSATATVVTADANGNVNVIYSTPWAVPLTGTDKVAVQNAARLPGVVGRDGYNYALY